MQLRASAQRILVVEDETPIAFGLSMLLEDWGYAVIGIAAAADQALAMALAEQPALTLMDVGLRGDMDGVDAAAALRRFSDTRLLFLTAQNDAVTTRRLRAIDADGVLWKPVEPECLRARIYRLLAGERRAARRPWSDVAVPAQQAASPSL